MYHLSTYEFADPSDVRLLDYMASTKEMPEAYLAHMRTFLNYKGLLCKNDADYDIDTHLIAKNSTIAIQEKDNLKTASLVIKENFPCDKLWSDERGAYDSFALYHFQSQAKEYFVDSQLKYDSMDRLRMGLAMASVHAEVITETDTLPSKSFWDKTMGFLKP